MRASVRESSTLTALKPLEVASYLRVRGWRQEAEIGDKGSIWVFPASGDGDEADITLPLRRDLGDFALDVLEGEPVVPPDLAALENLVLTPHVGGATWGARARAAAIAEAEALRVLATHAA